MTIRRHIFQAFSFFIAIFVVLCICTANIQLAYSQAAPYRCQPGYEPQINGSNAQCFKPEEILYQLPLPCPAGATLLIDHIGLEDKCVAGLKSSNGTSAQISNPLCPTNFRLEHLKQKDRCMRVIPAHTTKPLPP